jgi:AcrR family transcriptional regulator
MTDKAPPPKRRSRNPAETRRTILEAAASLIAQQGAEAVSVSAVSHLAGVNRGTAYQHFQSRDELVRAAMEWVSDRMMRAVFGPPETVAERRVEEVDVPDTMFRLVQFATENADLCRSWLLQILASPDPTSDPFWREFQGSLQRFTETDLAQKHVDADAMAVLVLSGIILWPVWVRAHAADDSDRTKLALRMSREILRLSMFGSMNPEKFPEVVARLNTPISPDDEVDIAGGR